ncbi:metabolite traffic protein EboE [Salinimicrobium catena]|uniref:metabolite traffic protein EboE n=1 Tax=Salinimicrobium catena TaxID=390640 RepID=UPI002FE4676E
MKQKDYHLTYCSNVHPGEDWATTFSQLQQHVLPLKERLAPAAPFGIGLRLSAKTAGELLENESLKRFQKWLEQHDLYVFTMNGFPYGAFHDTHVKEKVHEPDWSTEERLKYSKDLIHILGRLLPSEMRSGSISTSPVSYRYAEKNMQNDANIRKKVAENFATVVMELVKLKNETGKELHLDLEPEPDGMVESSAEAVEFFEFLKEEVGALLQEKLDINSEKSQEILLNHLRVCFDVCHSALLYEDPSEVMANFRKAGVKVGKIQISSALKVSILSEEKERKILKDRLQAFADPVYLHQVSGALPDGSFERYRDLPSALKKLPETKATEWRIHFHVPVFAAEYDGISSTRQQIEKVLSLPNLHEITSHLEIETYTWEVLPEKFKTSLTESIAQEYQWVQKNL